METASGRVWLVGAGPGDPELLTLKAVRVLAAADVVLIDDLVERAVLAHAPRARVVPVGKRGGCRATPQAFIERCMIREARAGHRVVRLKGGDPFLFGRGGEELAALQAAGIEVEVVNGITAGVAAAGAIGLPLTHRAHSHGVVFVTGHPAAGASVPWAALAAAGLTVVVYMGMARLAALAVELVAAGFAPELPVCVVQAASLPGERAVHATLATVARCAAGLASPAVIILGACAGLADALRAGGVVPALAAVPLARPVAG